ncbi:MAG: hypothetical protein GC172_05695 [Phycisphaera sp.]|nr:hypothetical protein [Phycisphaera sp.]
MTSDPNRAGDRDPLDLPPIDGASRDVVRDAPETPEGPVDGAAARDALAAAIPALDDEGPTARRERNDGGGHRDDDTVPLTVPRGLVVLAALWIFLSWVLLFGIRPPVQPQAASYGPSLEILFVSIGIGIAIGWPLLRLSARPSRAPILQAVLDALALVVLVQVVVWPLRLVTSWTLTRTLCVIGALAAAIALTAALLGAVQGARSQLRRTAGMLVAAGAALVPFALAVVGEWFAPSADSSFGAPGTVETEARGWLDSVLPVSAPALLGRFASPTPLDPPSTDLAILRTALVVAVVAWTVLLTARVRRLARGRPEGGLPLDY